MKYARFHGFMMALMVFLGLATACASPAGSDEAQKADPNRLIVDWGTLRPADSPNSWLLAPDGDALTRRDAAAPAFEVDAGALAEAWRAVVEAQPRTRILAVSDDGLRIEAEQKSAVFGFVDRISARIVPLAPHRSTLAVYSRAMTGYWDFGVNKTRVIDWLAALGREVVKD